MYKVCGTKKYLQVLCAPTENIIPYNLRVKEDKNIFSKIADIEQLIDFCKKQKDNR